MKRTVAAVGFLLAGAAGAEAQTAQQRYQGTFFVTSASGGCAEDDVAAVGDNFVFVFRSEQTRQAFALFRTRGAASYRPSTDGRFAAAGAYESTLIGSGAFASGESGRYSGFSTVPKTLAPTTQTVLVRGSLTAFDGVPGCTVGFIAAGVRRPGF